MLVQIFASSACTGVVCTIGASKTPNRRPTTSPERSPTPPTMHAEPVGVVVDPDHTQSAVGEGEGEREADAAEADDRDVVRQGSLAPRYCRANAPTKSGL